MLKQAIPPIVGGSQGDKSATGGGPAFPHLNNLPQWPRVNTLARSFPPKPLLKDRLTRLPESFSEKLILDEPMTSKNTEGVDNPNKMARLSVSSVSSERLVRQLEYSIAFLNQQHGDLLGSLHEEIDQLKRENRGNYSNLLMTRNHDMSIWGNC